MDFYKELTNLINKYSMEQSSNTPDFILADYMFNCLVAYNTAIASRNKWYGTELQLVDDMPNELKLIDSLV